MCVRSLFAKFDQKIEYFEIIIIIIGFLFMKKYIFNT